MKTDRYNFERASEASGDLQLVLTFKNTGWETHEEEKRSTLEIVAAVQAAMDATDFGIPAEVEVSVFDAITLGEGPTEWLRSKEFAEKLAGDA